MKNIFFILLLLIAIQQTCFTQSAFKIVIISPGVGEIIDTSERDYFHLFQTVKGFKQAVFFVDSSNSFYAFINFTDSKGSNIDTVIKYNKSYLVRTSEIIDNFEQVTSGGYQFIRMDYDFPTVEDTNNLLSGVAASSLVNNYNLPQVKESLNYNKNNISNSKNYDLLTLSDQKINIDLDHYPQLGFGVGISTALNASSEINSAISSIEEKYRSQGYSIKHNEYQLDVAGYLWLSLKVDIIKSVSISLDVGSTLGQTDEGMNTIKLFGTYKFDLFDTKTVRPYGGAGINCLFISLNENFNYYDRITPIDTSGRYDYLSSINISGEGTSLGLNVTAGIDIYSSPIALNLYADYSVMNPIKVQTSDNNAELSLNYSGFIIGAILLVYF